MRSRSIYSCHCWQRLFQRRKHSLLWHCGPELVRAMSEELAAHPKIARPVYLAEAIGGLVLFLRQKTGDASGRE